MRSSAQRKKKYAAKTDGVLSNKQITAHKKGFAGAVGSQVQQELLVKTVLTRHGVTPGLHHFYMNFGKKLGKLMGNYSGGTLVNEACVEWKKWELRELDIDILDEILCLYMPSICRPEVVCDYPAVEDVDWGVTYDTGNLTGTLDRGLPWTGQITVYQAGDDGTYQKGHTVPRPIVKGVGSHRFTDNGDGTISDKATGLMWVKDPINNPGAPFNATMNWTNAIINCEALNFAGHTDWRLPNIKELISIADYELGPPTIDGIFFPNTQSDRYWSSTTYAGYTDAAWYVYFFNGLVTNFDKGITYYVRPVRLGKP